MTTAVPLPMNVATKTCRDCQEDLPLDAFYRRKQTADGVGYICRPCMAARCRARYAADPERARERVAAWRGKHPDYVTSRTAQQLRKSRVRYRERNPDTARHQRLKSRYGLTPEQYDQMLDAQDGRCAACGQPETRLAPSAIPYRLSVDHDHDTGQVRGLLCKACNVILGVASEEPTRLRGIAAYIEERS